MRKQVSVYAARTFVLVTLMLCAAIAVRMPTLSQNQPPKVNVEMGSARETVEVSGAKLFHYYCAACHGRDGKGDGPAAPGLKTQPADLTLLAKKNGSKFPADRVLYVLTGETQSRLHGSKDMPIWGPIFRRVGPGPNLGRQRARNVVEYLQSIQAK